MARKTKEPQPKTAGSAVTPRWIKNKSRKIIGFSRSTVSTFLKRFDLQENIEKKPRTG